VLLGREPALTQTPPAAETRRVDELELRSVAQFALLFFVTAFGVLAAALAAVWLMTEALGLVGQFEDFKSSIGFRGFRIMSPIVILCVLLLFSAMIVFLTVLTVLFAGFYNLAARHGLGVRLRVSPHRRPQPLAPATSYDLDSRITWTDEEGADQQIAVPLVVTSDAGRLRLG
jgi:Transmembrane domain of unknown function (DUF3566)